MNRRQFHAWAAASLLAATTGCPWRRTAVPTTPNAFTAPPTLEEIIRVVNANSQPVAQLAAENVRLSTPGVPALKANLVLERPQRFRLRGELLGLTGPELDLGSNDDLFWLWIKRSQPPALYYSRHNEFHRSAARTVLPISPVWFVEALGLVTLDPQGRNDGPFDRGGGRVEIRCKRQTAEGEATHVYIIDDTLGLILEQQVFDPWGRLLAEAKASSHRYYPELKISLPDRVDIQLPPAELSFTLETQGFTVNQLHGDPQYLWAMPQMESSPLVNLADPRFRLPPAGPAPGQQPDFPHQPHAPLGRPQFAPSAYQVPPEESYYGYPGR